MSGEKADERVLSLEDLFLSGEFGRAHHEQPAAEQPAEPVLPRAPRAKPTAVGHGTTTHRRRSRAVAAASAIAAAFLLALGLVTDTGKGEPDRSGGAKGSTTAPVAAPPAPVPPVGGPLATPVSPTVALSAAPVVPATSDLAVRTSAPVQVAAPAPALPPTPAPPPAPAPAPASGPLPSAGPPASGLGDLVAAATELIDGVVTSAGDAGAGVVSNLGTTLPQLPELPQLPAPPSLPSVVSGPTASPFGPREGVPSPARYPVPAW
jgi:hypothetical protein